MRLVEVINLINASILAANSGIPPISRCRDCPQPSGSRPPHLSEREEETIAAPCTPHHHSITSDISYLSFFVDHLRRGRTYVNRQLFSWKKFFKLIINTILLAVYLHALLSEVVPKNHNTYVARKKYARNVFILIVSCCLGMLI